MVDLSIAKSDSLPEGTQLNGGIMGRFSGKCVWSEEIVLESRSGGV